MSAPTPHCTGCDRDASEIPDVVAYAEAIETTPNEFVRYEEGTYNPLNGHFLCDACYIAAGMPTAPGGWKAP